MVCLIGMVVLKSKRTYKQNNLISFKKIIAICKSNQNQQMIITSHNSNRNKQFSVDKGPDFIIFILRPEKKTILKNIQYPDAFRRLQFLSIEGVKILYVFKIVSCSLLLGPFPLS